MVTSTRPSYYFALLLTILGVAANYFNVTLFFGVDFLFGSVFSLLILAIFGMRTAVLATFAIASYTYSLWNHPYAFITLIFEIIFIARVWKKTRHNFTIASGLYWMFIGIPLVLVTYSLALKFSWEMTLLAGVKQAVNGILNSVIASVIISLMPSKFFPNLRGRNRSVFQVIFNSFVIAALIPSFTILVYDSQKVISHVEDSVRAQISGVRTEIYQSAVRWRRLHIGATQLLAKMVSDAGLKDPQKLKDLILKIKSMSPAFENILITDRAGKIVAFGPEPGVSHLIGYDFSDRASFLTLKSTSTDWLISPVFRGKLVSNAPTMITISSSIINGGVFEGIVSIAINLSTMEEILKSSLLNDGYIAYIVDTRGNIVISNDPKLKPLDKFEPATDFSGLENETSYYHRWPPETDLSPMAKWARSSIGTAGAVGADNAWTLFVEMPLVNQQSAIFAQYIQLMSILLIFVVLILIACNWLASKISDPLLELSEKTSNFSERLSLGEDISSLQSPFTEIKLLIDNFKIMASELRNRFTEVQDSSKKLQVANRVKDEFLATLSHELRTPLNIIVGHTELLKHSADLSEELLFSIDAIDRASSSQTQLISDLLDVSAITTGKIQFKPTSISVSNIAKALVENLQFSANRKGVILNSNISFENCMVFGDETRLQQIIWNLISNSIKFTPKGGFVIVEVLPEKDECVIRVRDTGKGIDKEFLPHIFERFKQEDSSSTRKYGGLGLGLSIVYHLVELHGGTVSVTSEGPDKGSTFEVRLPLLK